MAIGVLFIVAAAFGAYGCFRGALRFLLTLLPLILASVLLWLLGPLLYRIDILRNAGLMWPPAILVILGVAGGYVLRFIGRKKLPKRIHLADRIGGAALGLLLSLVVVWLGCVYVTVWSSSQDSARDSGSTARLARALDSAVLRWIPVVGSGSRSMTDLMEISTADEEVRRRALKELGFDGLLDDPQMQAVLDDPETMQDIEAAAKGSIPALWRLQKSPKILQLVESERAREAIDSHSLEAIVEAIRRTKQDVAEEP
ncbi:MAG: hypothetical protein JSU86_03065 [Phycisphaerales bacterium]|nr:MAG: hypothetical protein JSU86_03065 [Phycisphaerales bacterium]